MPMDETDTPRDLQFVPLNEIYDKLNIIYIKPCQQETMLQEI